MLNIEPIRLLSGKCYDTKETGQGCFMNVVSYLNGEDQITDKSPCVCVIVRAMVIWLNDYLYDKERQQLIPYIERAMGSKTKNKEELMRRVWLAVDFANKMSEIDANDSRYSVRFFSALGVDQVIVKHSAAYFAKRATKCARLVATHGGSELAGNVAAYAVKSAGAVYGNGNGIMDAGFQFLDDALPKASEPTPDVIKRATTLRQLALALGLTTHVQDEGEHYCPGFSPGRYV